MKNLKVCHVASVDMTVRFLLLPQLKSLLKEGYDICVVCSNGKMIKEIEREGIKVKTIEITRKLFSPISDIVAFIKLFFYFKKEKFDIIHTHAPKPALLGQLAAKMAGVPIIVNTIHGLYFTKDSSFIKKSLFILTEKISAKYSDFIFSQNKEDIKTVLKEGIAKNKKLGYLGNGIDLQRFSFKKVSENSILRKKKELGLSENVKIIGIVGRLVEEKGYLDLFEAMKEIVKKHPEALILSIGPEEPDKKDKLNKDTAKEYSIENNVKFLGQRLDIEELYPLMDVFVLPSHREGFPRSVIEAMAMQRPIVVTNIRGCKEEIDNGKNGIVVPVKNPKKLTEAILLLLDNEGKAKRLSENARIKAVEEFDENLVFQRILRQYKKLEAELHRRHS